MSHEIIPLRRPNRTRPLTNDELKRLAEKYPPDSVWYDGDFEPLMGIDPEGADYCLQDVTARQILRGIVCVILLAIILFGWIGMCAVMGADNISDLRTARANGLPAVSMWPDGFDLQWQLSQINAGHRINPVVRLPFPGDGSAWIAFMNGAPAGVAVIEPQLAALGALNLPLTLRCSNLPDSFGTDTAVYLGVSAGRRFRGLLQEVSPGTFTLQGTAVSSLNGTIAAHSPIIFKQATAGALYDQDRPADAFGPIGNWRLEGARWATSLWMRRVQDLVPNPTSIDFLDNNEGSFDYPSAYVSGGVLKSVADLRKISVRASEYVAANPGITAAQLQAEIGRRQVLCYDAAYAGFLGTVRPEWQSVPFTALGYSSGPDLENPTGLDVSPLYDVPSTGNTPATYLGGNKKTLPSLVNPGWTRIFNAIPAWEQLEAKSATSWRDMSVSISDGGAIYGAQLGQTEVIIPERYGGFWEFGLWGLRGVGRQVHLRHWQLNATKPSDKFFSATTAPIAVSLGYADAETVTHGDYAAALIAVVDRIHTEPYRSFYAKGKPIVAPGANPLDSYRKVQKQPLWPPSPVVDNRHRWLNCDCNSPDIAIAYQNDPVQSWSGQIKCWVAGTELNGQVLLFAYTPCKLGTVNIDVPNYGTFQIDMTGIVSGYWVVSAGGFTVKKL